MLSSERRRPTSSLEARRGFSVRPGRSRSETGGLPSRRAAAPKSGAILCAAGLLWALVILLPPARVLNPTPSLLSVGRAPGPTKVRASLESWPVPRANARATRIQAAEPTPSVPRQALASGEGSSLPRPGEVEKGDFRFSYDERGISALANPHDPFGVAVMPEAAAARNRSSVAAEPGAAGGNRPPVLGLEVSYRAGDAGQWADLPVRGAGWDASPATTRASARRPSSPRKTSSFRTGRKSLPSSTTWSISSGGSSSAAPTRSPIPTASTERPTGSSTATRPGAAAGPARRYRVYKMLVFARTAASNNDSGFAHAGFSGTAQARHTL